ncbi:MAG: hypothetical protein AAFX08_03610 [Pseudomonadota bacterium]
MSAELADAAGALADLLDAESDAVTKGDLGVASRSVAQKERLTVALERLADDFDGGALDAATERQLMRLRRARIRNERILEGAIEGVAQAQARVRQIAQRSSEVGVYGQDGGKLQFNEAAPGRGRRA